MYSPPKPTLYEFTWVFEVGYRGERYLIDGCHSFPALYIDTPVPQEVAEMADGAIGSAYRARGYDMSEKEARNVAQIALESVFDDVRLVKDDYPYGAIF